MRTQIHLDLKKQFFNNCAPGSGDTSFTHAEMIHEPNFEFYSFVFEGILIAILNKVLLHVLLMCLELE